MTFSASWHARRGPDGLLATVGIMLLGSNAVVFRAFPEAEAYGERLVAEIVTACLKTPIKDVFMYYTERGNGVTSQWSEPFAVEGATLYDAAKLLMDGLRR